jgi:hypothetical protein
VTTKDQFPAFLFAAGLLALTIVLVIVYVSDAGAWCDADDRSTAVCLRNWAGAGGSLVAVIIAGLAASFTYGQLKTASRHADLTALEPVEHRIATAKKVRHACLHYIIGIENVDTVVSQVLENVAGANFSVEDLKSDLSTCSVFMKYMFKEIEHIDKIIFETVVDNDIYELCNQLVLVMTRTKSELKSIIYTYEQFNSENPNEFDANQDFYRETLISERLMVENFIQNKEKYKNAAEEIRGKLGEILQEAETKRVRLLFSSAP